MTFFPHHTVTWHVEEPPALRKLTLSLVEMAAITGVVLHLYRAVVFTHGSHESFSYVALTFAGGALFLFLMATIHLANHTVRQWLWRAPLFAFVEVAAEMLTALVLVAVHREPLGSARAEFHDLPALALNVLATHAIGISLFALLLAGVVQLVRRLLLRHEHRMHTALAVHESREHRAVQ